VAGRLQPRSFGGPYAKAQSDSSSPARLVAATRGALSASASGCFSPVAFGESETSHRFVARDLRVLTTIPVALAIFAARPRPSSRPPERGLRASRRRESRGAFASPELTDRFSVRAGDTFAPDEERVNEERFLRRVKTLRENICRRRELL
jgi:hypothetical protein